LGCAPSAILLWQAVSIQRFGDANSVDDIVDARQIPSFANNNSAIHQHVKFTRISGHRLHIDFKLLMEGFRHTGGMFF